MTEAEMNILFDGWYNKVEWYTDMEVIDRDGEYHNYEAELDVDEFDTYAFAEGFQTEDDLNRMFEAWIEKLLADEEWCDKQTAKWEELYGENYMVSRETAYERYLDWLIDKGMEYDV